MEHVHTPVRLDRQLIMEGDKPRSRAFLRLYRDSAGQEIVHIFNTYDSLLAQRAALVAACEAAVRYDKAIRSCANDPDQMSSYCTTRGEDLNSLYFDWIVKARTALALVKGDDATT